MEMTMNEKLNDIGLTFEYIFLSQIFFAKRDKAQWYPSQKRIKAFP